MPQRTQLYRYHVDHARMTDFAGFEMPLYYKGIVQEALAVRSRVGIFDISHMGRVIVEGPNAETFLNYVTTNDVSSLKPGQAHYSLLCNEKGGIKDDIVVLRLEATRFVMIFNAGNRTTDRDWLSKHSSHRNVDLKDISDEAAMISVQGPKARLTLQKLLKLDLANVPRFGCLQTELGGMGCLISRTGYTGEDGFEMLVWDSPIDKPEKAEAVWASLLASGAEFGTEPCGLGARDVLRLEAGMCLYGSDIDENITPYEARLGFTVKLAKTDFIGKPVLEKQKAEGVRRLRVGVRLTTHGVPRPGCEIVSDGEIVGRLTSGTLSPTLNCGIGMGYALREYANEGQKVEILVRGKQLGAVVAKFPFYQTDAYGWQRKA